MGDTRYDDEEINEQEKQEEGNQFWNKSESLENEEEPQLKAPTAPNKPGFFDWLAGLFNYKTETVKKWEKYQQELSAYEKQIQERKKQQEKKQEEPEKTTEKEKELSAKKEDLTKSGVMLDDEFVTMEDLAKGNLKKSGVMLEDEFVTKEELGANEPDTIHDKMAGLDDIPDVSEDELDDLDMTVDNPEKQKTPAEKLHDIDVSFTRMAQAINPQAGPVEVNAQNYAIPTDIALYCTVAAAQSSGASVAEDLGNIFNGTNMQPLVQAKAIWENTPAEKRPDLLVHGVKRLGQMAAEPIGLDKEMIMSGLVIGNTLGNMQGSLRQSVIDKLQGQSRDMVLGAQEIGQIGHRGLFAGSYLQNPKFSSTLSPQWRKEMITSALAYEAVGQLLNGREVSRTSNGMPIPSSLQQVMGRADGKNALHSSVEKFERGMGDNSLYSMNLDKLAQTMQNPDSLKQHTLPLKQEKQQQMKQAEPQKSKQMKQEKQFHL